MKVADYIIDFFSKKGIEKAFIVYGAANGDLIDAFTRNKKIQYVATMHEQAAGFAAEGYAKIKRLDANINNLIGKMLNTDCQIR